MHKAARWLGVGALALAPLVQAQDAEPAAAQAGSAPQGKQRFYAGLRLGATLTNEEGSGLSGDLQSRGHDVTATVDNSDDGFVLYAGWEALPKLALEAGLTWLGEYQLRVNGTTGDPQGLAEDLAQLRPVNGWGLSLAARTRVPLAEGAAILPKAGLYLWTLESEFDSLGETKTEDADGIGLTAGIALAWKVTDLIDLGAGVDVLRPRPDEYSALLYGQIEFKFEL